MAPPAKRPPGTASRLRLLQRVDESFELMLHCIHEAKRSVRLEMYIYSASPIGEQFREALLRACERGLQVKVLIDAFGSISLSDKFWDPFREAGGQFRWFNPLKLDRLSIRDHRKLLVCDESVAFVGGFNIATEYQGDGITQGWRDLGVQVHGEMAAQLAASFDTLFALADFRHKRFARLRKSAARQLHSTPDGEVILSGPGRSFPFLKSSILNDIQKSKRIQIISAYFLPTRPIRRALAAAARKGAKVQLILAGKSDVPLTQFASRRFYPGFFRAGIEVYEYQPQILHAKLFIFDNVVYIGSANLDRRSLYINYELMVRLSDPSLAKEAEETFQNDLQLSRRIDPVEWKASRTFWTTLRERWAHFLLARVDPYIARYHLRNLR